MGKGLLFVVGVGPGDNRLLTDYAKYAIEQSDIVCGYERYVKQIENFLNNKNVCRYSMGKEIERVDEALKYAKTGHKVSLVSGGDASLYAMASLVFERNSDGIDVEVVAGITAALAASSRLGAPISDDLAIISMSDLLTPWDVIKKRIEAVNIGDFVCAVYNPKSEKRVKQLRYAMDSFKQKRGDLFVGVVKNCFRDNEETRICRISTLDYEFIDMRCIVIVGNSFTYKKGSSLITPRGYKSI